MEKIRNREIVVTCTSCAKYITTRETNSNHLGCHPQSMFLLITFIESFNIVLLIFSECSYSSGTLGCLVGASFYPFTDSFVCYKVGSDKHFCISTQCVQLSAGYLLIGRLSVV